MMKLNEKQLNAIARFPRAAKAGFGRCAWNSDSKNTLIKMIRGLLRGDLMKTIRADHKRLGDDASRYMGDFYKEMVAINKVFNIDKNSEIYLNETISQMFPNKTTHKDSIVGEILQSNFRLLHENGLLEKHLNDFAGYFSGDMQAIHKIGNTDVIVFEFNQKPFSNEKQYHLDEPDLKKFYNNKNTNYVWNTFEDSLINAIFPNYYNAVGVLLEKEKEEA